MLELSPVVGVRLSTVMIQCTCKKTFVPQCQNLGQKKTTRNLKASPRDPDLFVACARSLTSVLDDFRRALERPSERHHRLAPDGHLAPRDDGLGKGGVVAVLATLALVAEDPVVSQNWRPQGRELRLVKNLVKNKCLNQ